MNIKLGMLALKILGPIALVIGVIWYHNNAVSNAEQRGFDSRNEEVRVLTDERDTALVDITTLKGDLKRCQDNRLLVETDLSNAKSKIVALGDENAKALRLQAETFAATQAATSNAMSELARNIKSSDIDFAGILEQLKGVNYDYDENSGKCIIRGGGRVLSNAARGKTGN